MSTVKTLWAPWMGEVPMHLEYFRGSMTEMVEGVAEKHPGITASEFMGSSITYNSVLRK